MLKRNVDFGASLSGSDAQLHAPTHISGHFVFRKWHSHSTIDQYTINFVYFNNVKYLQRQLRIAQRRCTAAHCIIYLVPSNALPFTRTTAIDLSQLNNTVSTLYMFILYTSIMLQKALLWSFCCEKVTPPPRRVVCSMMLTLSILELYFVYCAFKCPVLYY